MMRYPVLIEEGSRDTAFGVAVPDLPECFSAGDTLDEALNGAKEAVAAWVDAALDAGQAIPAPMSLELFRLISGYNGWKLGLLEVDPALFDDSIDRVKPS